MDNIGLSTVWTITEYWANQSADPEAKANAAFLKPYVEKGALGVKTMQGFYSYPHPRYASPGFIERGGEQERSE
jgi:3-hydroxybutyryl-CoA dehydrogenase